jgi:hypothetical protein
MRKERGGKREEIEKARAEHEEVDGVAKNFCNSKFSFNDPLGACKPTPMSTNSLLFFFFFFLVTFAFSPAYSN